METQEVMLSAQTNTTTINEKYQDQPAMRTTSIARLNTTTNTSSATSNMGLTALTRTSGEMTIESMEETSFAKSKYPIPISRRINQTFSYCSDDGTIVCEPSKTQYLYGGDGDDYLKPGNNWKTSRSYGENGNDTFIAPSGTERTYFYGGDGNDTVEVAAYGDLEDSSTPEIEYFYGDDGDDVIRGSHKASVYQRLEGGNGQDKLYGGDGAAQVYLAGNDGDDWLQGGDNATGPQDIYGDTYGSPESQTGGDDVIYGGNNGEDSQFLVGGKGSDKIFSGHGMENADGDSNKYSVTVYGDNYHEIDEKRGEDGDGDDLIDIGDSPNITGSITAFGMGGNDKLIGSIGAKE